MTYQTNKKTGIKYAYESESYKDPVTKKPKFRRTYLGRVDPVTGEIIPKAESGKRNRASVSDPSIPDHVQDELASRNETIRTLRQQVSTFETTLNSLKAARGCLSFIAIQESIKSITWRWTDLVMRFL